MADQLKDNTPSSGDNSASRKDQIIGVCKKLESLETDRKKISDEIKGLKNSAIKGDLGMKISDFNIARRFYILEGDDRDQMLSTIHETFNALGVGEQLDFIKASERLGAGKEDLDNVVGIGD